MSEGPTPALREAYDGLDGVHDALARATRAYSRESAGGCPCAPPALSEALESVQDAELKLEALIWPKEDGTRGHRDP